MKKILDSRINLMIISFVVGSLITGFVTYILFKPVSQDVPLLITEDIYNQIEQSGDDASDYEVVKVLRPYFATMATISSNFIQSAEMMSERGHVFEKNQLAYIEQLKKTSVELHAIVNDFK